MSHTIMEGPQLSVQNIRFSPVLRIVARVVSVVFHPLFIPVYISLFLIYINPVLPAFDASEKLLLVLRFVVMYTVFPLATILLARALGFVQTVYLKTQKDRIIPYIACGIYYFWMWYVLRNQPQFPKEIVMLALAIFIAASMGLLANSYIKVSMHTISAGVMLAFMFLLAFLSAEPFGLYLSVALLITGAVSTARLINFDHYPFEVYLGLAIGIVAQLIAYAFVF